MTASSNTALITDALGTRQVILFDFDGVIADTEPLHLQAYQEVLEDQFSVVLSDEVFASDLMGWSEVEIYRKLERLFGIEIDNQVFRYQRLARFEALVTETHLQPSWIARTVFDYAAESGFTVSVVTSQDGGLVRRLLDYWHLLQVRAICSASDLATSKQVLLERVKELLDVDPNQAVLFEDSQSAIDVASRQGIRTVGVQHGLTQANLEADVVIAID